MTLNPQPEPLAGSAPAEPPQDASKQIRSTDATRHARERIVLLSMVLVTMATAATLYVLYEFPLGSALLAAGGIWALLMTVHLQLRKDQEIARLRTELHRLERQADNAQAAVAAARNGAYVSAPADVGEVSESTTGSAIRDPAVLEKAIKETVAQQAPSRASIDVDAQSADSIPRKPQPTDDMAEEVATATAAMRLNPDPRWGENQRPQRMATPAAATPQRPVQRQPATAAPAEMKQHPGSTSDEAALWPGTEVSAADPMRDQWAFRPRSEVENEEAGATGAMPSLSPTTLNEPKKPASIEADLEMVQRKIKALADEVNAADAARERERQVAVHAEAGPEAIAKGGKPEPQQRTSMIEKSIGALKSAASSMRAKSGPPDAVMGLDDEESLGKRSERGSPKIPVPAGPQTRIGPQPATAGGMREPLSFDLLIPKTAETIAASAPRRGEAKLPPLPDVAIPEVRQLQAASPVNPRIAAIAAALHDGEMDIFLSPIVALESHQVSHYDVTVRLRNHAGEYLDEAEQELRLQGSDLLALFDAVRLYRSAMLADKLDAHNRQGSLLSDVNGYSMTNAGFLDTFARVYEERERISNQLVLTFSQADVEQFKSSAWQALSDMQAFGFRFALSKIDHADMDFATLSKRGFAFLRLDASALLNGLPARNRFLGPDELCSHLAGAGMTLVADTIDDETIRARVFGFGILFGQGRLFGGARQIKLDPLPPTSSAAA